MHLAATGGLTNTAADGAVSGPPTVAAQPSANPAPTSAPDAAATHPDAAVALLRQGGVVLAMRHALAPGTYDPPGFRLDDCRTQRNLSEAGRDQARRIGQWLAARQLRPTRVRSSPWCRCLDTAQLAFGQAQPWAALGAPQGQTAQAYAQALQTLAQALADAARQPGRFEAWVTHQFVLNDLVGTSTGSGEGLVLGAGPDGRPRLLARLDHGHT